MQITDIPSAFGDYVGMSEVTAQILLSVVIILMFVLPTMYLAKSNTTLHIIMTFLALTVCIGLGWAPFWLLIAIASCMAMAWAFLGTRLVTGD
jgi:hypothetical protein